MGDLKFFLQQRWHDGDDAGEYPLVVSLRNNFITWFVVFIPIVHSSYIISCIIRACQPHWTRRQAFFIFRSEMNAAPETKTLALQRSDYEFWFRVSHASLQCNNGHLMCAGCLTHLLADARLKDETASCPNCRCEISKTQCSRNLAVEKAVCELPTECQYCNKELPRAQIERHMAERCEER